ELEGIPGVAQPAEHIFEIGLAEVREHPAVVDVRAPPHQAVPVRLAPESGDKSAQEQMLRKAHARVRRHLEGAHLDQPQPATAALGREKLVDAELGAMRVAARIDEQITEEAVAEPGGREELRVES